MLILATRLSTLLHELIGHGYMALVFGGQVSGIKVSLLGGGITYYQLNRETVLLQRFLVSFGGIIINLLSGMIALMFIRRLQKHPLIALFLNLFGMVSLLGAIAYTALGFYYGEGDPVSWMVDSSMNGGWFWLPFLMASPVAGYYAIKSYAMIYGRWYSSRSFASPIQPVIMTLGLSLCAYAGLYGLTGQRSMAMDAPLAAYQRAENEIRKMKMEDLYRQIRELHPELSDDEIRRQVESTPIMIQQEEVPQRFPLKPVLASLFLAGGLLAICHVKGARDHLREKISPLILISTLILAGVVLLFLSWTGGWVYRSG